jgi:hypothetical protein
VGGNVGDVAIEGAVVPTGVSADVDVIPECVVDVAAGGLVEVGSAVVAVHAVRATINTTGCILMRGTYLMSRVIEQPTP